MVNHSKKIAIIGAGASGCICAYFLIKSGIDVTLFDKKEPLLTLLATGGGRCNLAHAEYDFKELTKNYPRGEKFLLSIFSKFSTWDTLSLFEELGIKTYVQDDNRIFPESNSAKYVRKHILSKIQNAKFIKHEVKKIEQKNNKYYINNEEFSHVVIAIGGHAGYNLLKDFGINIIPPKPSLVGLNTKESFNDISGTVCKNSIINGHSGDILFTHFGLSGPLIYKISSIKAFDEFPYELTIDLAPQLEDLQSILNVYPHKEIKNILKEWIPQKMVSYILREISPHPNPLPQEMGQVAEINPYTNHIQQNKVEVSELNSNTIKQTKNIPILNETTKAHAINGKIRDVILDKIHNFKVTITGTNKGEETVTAGGVDLNEINPKTMEVKKINGLYCIGEVLNIDGFCGGFNLQNAWSTAYIASERIKQ